MVSVQCCKLFAIVPCKGVSGIAMVTADPQLVEVGLGLQSEAGILCKHLPAGPVLQRDEQFVVSLVGQPVDVLQPQPVLTIYVAKTLLWRGKQKIRKKLFWKLSKFLLDICRTIEGQCTGSGDRYGWSMCGLLSGRIVIYQVCSSLQEARSPMLFYFWNHSWIYCMSYQSDMLDSVK